METLVKGIAKHDAAGYHEIGGTETSIGMKAPLLCRMVRGCFQFIPIAKVCVEQSVVLGDGNTSVNDVTTLGDSIVVKEVLTVNSYVTVEEEEPWVPGLLGQEIPDGSTTSVLPAFYHTAAG